MGSSLLGRLAIPDSAQIVVSANVIVRHVDPALTSFEFCNCKLLENTCRFLHAWLRLTRRRAMAQELCGTRRVT